MNENRHSHDDVVREFWATFLDSEVAKDGQVKGYKSWWDRQDPELQAVSTETERDCCRKVARGMPLEDATAICSLALKDYIAHRTPPKKARPDYARFRLGLLSRIYDEKLRPFEVAALLEQAMTEHREIPIAEVDAFRSMGEHWQPWRGFDFDYAAHTEAWVNRGEEYRHLWDQAASHGT